MTKTTTKRMGLGRNEMTYGLGRTRPATEEETFIGLSLKMFEEVGELTRAPKDLMEYADVLQTLMDFAEINGIEWGEVLDATYIKKCEKGNFVPGLLWLAYD